MLYVSLSESCKIQCTSYTVLSVWARVSRCKPEQHPMKGGNECILIWFADCLWDLLLVVDTAQVLVLTWGNTILNQQECM